MLSHRYQIGLLLGLLTVVSLYLLLPLVASYLLAQGLRQHGYKNVIIQLGYPGWQGMRIPVVSYTTLPPMTVPTHAPRLSHE